MVPGGLSSHRVIRPLLCRAAESCGNPGRKSTRFACVIQYYHANSLPHSITCMMHLPGSQTRTVPEREQPPSSIPPLRGCRTAEHLQSMTLVLASAGRDGRTVHLQQAPLGPCQVTPRIAFFRSVSCYVTAKIWTTRFLELDPSKFPALSFPEGYVEQASLVLSSH